jgi:hypothetical protein
VPADGIAFPAEEDRIASASLPRSQLESESMRAVFLCLAIVVTLLLSADEPDFKPLFNGKDLSEFDGDKELWKLADGVIVGDSPGIKHNQFLKTKKLYDDFELRLEFRLTDGIGNSGIQFRSKAVEDSTEVEGYQADIGQEHWGCLYDESRRRKVLAFADEKLADVLKKDDWNEYVIRAEGKRITLKINGQTTVDYTEPDADIPQTGFIALQVHSGPPLKVEFRKLRIKELKEK